MMQDNIKEWSKCERENKILKDRLSSYNSRNNCVCNCEDKDNICINEGNLDDVCYCICTCAEVIFNKQCDEMIELRKEVEKYKILAEQEYHRFLNEKDLLDKDCTWKCYRWKK